MSNVPSREARLAHAVNHPELWNAGKKEEWLASWRSILPADVKLYDPVGTKVKTGFNAPTSDAWDLFHDLLKLKIDLVHVNGNAMAWVCENTFGVEPNVQVGSSIEFYSWDEDGNATIETFYPMPEHVGEDDDPYDQLLKREQD